MCSLKIVLGLDPVQEIDSSALPTLATLCETLQLRTHLDPSTDTFYVESPLAGKRLVIIPAPAGPLDTSTLATAAANRTREQLVAIGATAAVLAEGAPVPQCDLAVRLGPGSLTADGVSVTYNWMGHRENRKLAVYLAEEVARSTGMVNLGNRASLGGSRHRGVPVAWVATGMPPREHDRERLPGAMANGICQALARFWETPVLAQIRTALQSMPAPPIPPTDLATEPPATPPAELPAEPTESLAEPPAEDPVPVLVLDLLPPTPAPKEEDEPVAHLASFSAAVPLLAWPPTDQILGIEPPAPDPAPAPTPEPPTETAVATAPADLPVPAQPTPRAHLLATSAVARIPARTSPTAQPIAVFNRHPLQPAENLQVFQRGLPRAAQRAQPAPPAPATLPPPTASLPSHKPEPPTAHAAPPMIRIIESGGTLYHRFP